MIPYAQTERILLYLTTALYLVLLLKIYLEPALHKYKFFALYIAVQAARALGMMPLRPDTSFYALLYFFTAPILWICYVLVVIELYSVVLRQYTGIERFARRVLGWALGFSVLFSLLTLAFDLANESEKFKVILRVLAVERLLTSSLLLLVIAITSFVLAFPVPLPRNVILHSMVCFVYFFSRTLGLFVRNITGPEITQVVSIVLMGTATFCVLLWLVFLNRAGEHKLIRQRLQWGSHSQERALQHLGSINASLVRSARKSRE